MEDYQAIAYMGYILKEIGMEEQMLRQLMLSAPMEQVEHLMEEKKELGVK